MKLRENTITRIALCLFVMLLCSNAVVGQTASMNYVRKSQMTELYTSNPTIDFENARITIDYYDGLGRPIQSVDVAKAIDTYSVYTHTEYDNYGRPYRQWLPVSGPSITGEYVDPATVQQTAKEFYGDNYPFTESLPDRTPELREATVWNPGEAWRSASKSISKIYGFNRSDSVRFNCPLFDVASNGSLIYRGPYLNGRLRYELTRGEDGCDEIKFYDFDNRLILDRRYSSGKSYDTHYVYNICGLLTYVISPRASTVFLEENKQICDTASVRKLCWHYAYDDRGRVIERRSPGAEPEYLVYDALGNVVLRQDGNLRADGQWWAVKLDSRYRKISEGTAVYTNYTRADLQAIWNNKLPIETPDFAADAEFVLFYTDTCGINSFIPKVSYFYDNYNHWTNLIGSLPAETGYTQGNTNGMGLLTGKAVYNCFGNPMISAYVYDDARRMTVDARAELYGGVVHRTFYNYSFAGDLLKKKEIFQSSQSSYTTSEHLYHYHTSGDLQQVRHSFNGATPITLYTRSYDDVGRLSGRLFKPRLYSANKRINYTYNLRGWTTGIGSPEFTQHIRYEKVPNGATPRYDGSPGAMTFTSTNLSTVQDSVKLHYFYDNIGRLTEVNQQNTLDGNKLFSESFIYDDNGNAISITRGDETAGLIQNLNVSYDGNHISSVVESKSNSTYSADIPTIASGTYGSGWKHDSNGNIKADPSRGVTSVIYNARNLPEQVVFSDGSRLYGYYMGDGEYAGSREREKIITTVDGGTGTKATYLTTTRKQFGNFVETNSTLSRVYIDEGYIDVSGGATGSEYHYYVKDWQGSVRAIIDEEGELKQTVDYSAYGVPSTRYGMTEDNRLHLGLEWQSMKGWNSYQNNARTRDPLYARFQQQDPLADKYYPFSPYHYGACNPLRFMDFDGQKLFAIHGTWSSSNTWRNQQALNNFASKQFGDTDYNYKFNWDKTGNSAEIRTDVAKQLIKFITDNMEGMPNTEPITIIGHSHGGNVGIEALNEMVSMLEFEGRELNLVTINTPVRDDYQLSEGALERVNHINVYDSKDPVQIFGGKSTFSVPILGEFGKAGRTFPNAQNISVDNPVGIEDFLKGKNKLNEIHDSHNRIFDWIYKVK